MNIFYARTYEYTQLILMKKAIRHRSSILEIQKPGSLAADHINFSFPLSSLFSLS